MLVFTSLFLAGVFLSQGSPVLNDNAPSVVVKTTLGAVSGWERVSRDGRPYFAWTRLPYAQPPVGKLRLMAPKPAQAWSGVLNATGRMPHCMQNKDGQEDCLYLNVFRPKISLDNMPVLVYVHGGGFQAGDGAAPENADYIMDEDVILVSIHYRLNGFGFMTLGDKILPGNFGLKDQAMAMKWIKQNIAAFGGDPNSITVFGVSAGGASAHYLIKSPVCDDIVSRAVSDSGTINHVWSMSTVDFEKASTLAVAADVGCTNEDHSEILACLQSVSASVLMSAIGRHYPNDPSRLTYLPVIEPEDAEDAFMTEDLSLRPTTKPWITSTTNGEYLLFSNVSNQPFYDRLQQNLTGYLQQWILNHNDDPVIVKEGATMLEVNYFLDRVRTENMKQEFAKMTGDDWFVFPALFNMIHRGPKWMYRFEYKGEYSGIDPATGKTWTPPNVAGHAEEWLFYFNAQPTPQNAADKAVSKRLIKYLVNFAYYDNPTPPGSPYTWNQFTHDEVWRITSQGDFQGDGYFYQQLQTIVDTWTYILGWN